MSSCELKEQSASAWPKANVVPFRTLSLRPRGCARSLPLAAPRRPRYPSERVSVSSPIRVCHTSPMEDRINRAKTLHGQAILPSKASFHETQVPLRYTYGPFRRLRSGRAPRARSVLVRAVAYGVSIPAALHSATRDRECPHVQRYCTRTQQPYPRRPRCPRPPYSFIHSPARQPQSPELVSEAHR